MKFKSFRVSVLLVLALAVQAAATQVPRCWVLSCRGGYNERCIACIMASCGNAAGNDLAARAWCFNRVRMSWPRGTPGSK